MQTATGNGAGEESGEVSAASEEGKATTQLETQVGRSLPSTGEDVLKVVLVGLLLTGGGLAPSVRSRRA